MSKSDVLKELRRGKKIVHPVSKQTIQPTQYIIVDAPMGKVHKQTAQYVDLFIHVETPLDIAMASTSDAEPIKPELGITKLPLNVDSVAVTAISSVPLTLILTPSSACKFKNPSASELT